jgi:hypothetical protein
MSHTKILQSIFEKKMSDAKDMIDETLNQKLAVELISLYEKKKLDPVGKEDGDIDNDGDEDETDSYLLNRRKAIGKAMKKEDMQYEAISDRPLDGGSKKKKKKSENTSGDTVVRRDSRSFKFKKLNNSFDPNDDVDHINEVDLSHQSAHDHNETEAREKKVGVGKVVRAKGGSY